jgi:soluble lytic murein transglycosylase
LYRACYESFASEAQGSYCHWKLVWAAYLRRAPEAPEMLRTHLLAFPASEKAGAALYYLGRLAEGQDDTASAKAYYTELQKRFPNVYYYAVPGRALLAKPAISKVATSPEVAKFLESVKFPERRSANFEASGITRDRIERARLLVMAALESWAQGELRYAARTDGQGHALAYEMAQIESRRGSPFQALRYIKGFAPGYLFLPFEAAPVEFWRLAFPMPYRSILEKYCKANELDPFLIAALILQESEFNPGAISRAKARGLMQVMVRTGAQLAPRLGIRRLTTGMLYDPEINIRLGTYYFRQMLDQHGGNVEKTLAAYNAGKSRVDRWSLWGEYGEPGEFIETIPFTETRGYVQIVLRNAAMYRRLYGSGSPAVSSDSDTTRK